MSALSVQLLTSVSGLMQKLATVLVMCVSDLICDCAFSRFPLHGLLLLFSLLYIQWEIAHSQLWGAILCLCPCYLSISAYSRCWVTVGGVLVFPDETCLRFFGANVPGSLVDEWFSAMKHIIGPVETYALLVARSVWHQHLVGKRCIYFCDNYGAMDAFIKGTSSNSDIRELLLCFEKLECNGSHWPWFSRVPSASNCADDPTRVGHVLGRYLKGAIRDRCMCPLTGLQLTDFVGST